MIGAYRPRLRQAITPIALAAVSFLAAVALWVAVTDAENPASNYQLPVSLRIETFGAPDGLAVRSISPDGVSVTVRATDDTIEDLTASNFRAQVNLSGAAAGVTSLPVNVEVVDIDDVEIVEVSSQVVEVTLETEASKMVPVQVRRVGSQVQGFSISETEANPDEVRVTGAASLIERIESAVADVNLTGVRSTIRQQYNLTARDASGADFPRVTVEPSSAEIRMSVTQQDQPAILPVRPDIQGTIAAGYEITSVTVDPPSIGISGPIESILSLTEVMTSPIDISGATADLTRSVRLQVPTGLTPSRDSVTVTIAISPSIGERAVVVAPTIEDVPNGLTAIPQTASVTVRVRGEVPQLNSLAPGSIRAVVRATNLPEGVHVLNVEVSLPEGLEVIGVDPPQAVITLRP